MNHEYFWHWSFWWFPMLMPIFWIVIIAVVLYLIFRRGGPRKPWEPGQEPGPRESALDILKRRYAKGEITKDQFEQMKRDILS
jgi:putative membrane protein